MVDHHRDDRHRMLRHQQPQQFARDPFARQRHQVVGARGAGIQPGGIDPVAEPRMEAEEAQDAQVILRDAPQRIADEAHPARGQIVQPAEIVEHLARRRVRIERVHREIAPGRIRAPVIAERDHRVPAIGRDVAAQGRHLDRAGRQDRGDGAVRDPRRHRADAGGAQPVQYVVGQQPRGKVDIGDVHPQQRVAHRAADDPGLAGGRVQRVGQRRQPVARAPRCTGQGHAHRSRRARLTIIAAVAPQIRRSPQLIS